MSGQIETGTAFPVVHPDGKGVQYFGMSLRDYFAARALEALISEPPFGEGSESAVLAFSGGFKGDPLQRYAYVAYRFADAMLIARAQ